jgi:DNA anti-recombination protein RmuC
MPAPRTVELKRRIADSSTTIDQRLEAVIERIDQVEDESSGQFVQMKEFISDSFRTAQLELTKGLAAVRSEMASGFAAVEGRLGGIEGRLGGIEGRLGGVEGRLDGVDGRLDGVDGHLDRIEGKLDRALTARPARSRRSKRRR